jgi:hypothetical protein
MVPKMSAPTDLSMSVMVIPYRCESAGGLPLAISMARKWEQLTQVTSEFSTPKSFATSVTVNETVAKSNASHILQKRNISTSAHQSRESGREPREVFVES